MTGLHCGIDIGSTNLKVVLVDEEGRVAYGRTVPTPRVADGGGVATDARNLVDRLEAMIVEGWRTTGRGAPLRSISAAGVGEDGVCVDAGLRPTGPSLPWFDDRADAEAVELGRPDLADPRAGIAVGPDRTAAKWLWLHRHRPREAEAASAWIALTDFPLVHWSGQPFMSVSLAPRTACYDVFGRRWLPGLLARAHAPPLPMLLPAGAVVGGVRSGPLRESGAATGETLVVAGGHDHPVAAVTLRRLNGDARVDSLGTANLVYGETTRAQVPVAPGRLALSLPPRGGAGLACLGVVEFASALARAGLDGAAIRAALRARRFAGEPGDGPPAAGAPGALAVRRALEGLTLEARDMLAEMDGLGVPAGPIFMTGGWSRSIALAELRASVFGRPVRTFGDIELAAVGAALLGAEASAGAPPPVSACRGSVEVDPVDRWAPRYEEMFAARTRGGGGTARAV